MAMVSNEKPKISGKVLKISGKVFRMLSNGASPGVSWVKTRETRWPVMPRTLSLSEEKGEKPVSNDLISNFILHIKRAYVHTFQLL